VVRFKLARRLSSGRGLRPRPERSQSRGPGVGAASWRGRDGQPHGQAVPAWPVSKHAVGPRHAVVTPKRQARHRLVARAGSTSAEASDSGPKAPQRRWRPPARRRERTV